MPICTVRLRSTSNVLTLQMHKRAYNITSKTDLPNHRVQTTREFHYNLQY